MLNVPKVCLAVANPRKFDIKSLRAWILQSWTIAPLEDCLAVANPYQRRSKERSPTTHLSCTMLSGINGAFPWAIDASESALYLVEVALPRYSSVLVAGVGSF